MPWDLGTGDWGSSAGRSVAHLFFQVVWIVPVPMESAGDVGKG